MSKDIFQMLLGTKERDESPGKLGKIPESGIPPVDDDLKNKTLAKSFLSCSPGQLRNAFPSWTSSQSRLSDEATSDATDSDFFSEAQTTIRSGSGGFLPVKGVVSCISADLMPFGFCCLSGGMALSGIGWLPAATHILIFAAISSQTLAMIGRTASTLLETRPCLELTYVGVWKVLIGKASWVPSLAVFAACFGNCVAYSCVFAELLADAWEQRMHEHERARSRTWFLVGASVFPVLPLCTFRDLSSLAQLSAAVIPVLLYLIGFMSYRAYDGSYQRGGEFYKDRLHSPASVTTTSTSAREIIRFGCCPMLFVNVLFLAYLVHYNGMKYYRELAGKSDRPRRFESGVSTSHCAAAFFYVLTLWLGYCTFGDNTTGALLSNYHHKDDLANLAHIVLALALLLTYPLTFSGLREAAVSILKELLPEREHIFQKKTFRYFFTLVFLSVITWIAYLITDVWLLCCFVGSVPGSIVVYILPTFLFILAHKDNRRCLPSVLMASMILALGLLMGICGLYATIVFRG